MPLTLNLPVVTFVTNRQRHRRQQFLHTEGVYGYEKWVGYGVQNRLRPGGRGW